MCLLQVLKSRHDLKLTFEAWSRSNSTMPKSKNIPSHHWVARIQVRSGLKHPTLLAHHMPSSSTFWPRHILQTVANSRQPNPPQAVEVGGPWFGNGSWKISCKTGGLQSIACFLELAWNNRACQYSGLLTGSPYALSSKRRAVSIARDRVHMAYKDWHLCVLIGFLHP